MSGLLPPALPPGPRSLERDGSRLAELATSHKAGSTGPGLSRSAVPVPLVRMF